MKFSPLALDVRERFQNARPGHLSGCTVETSWSNLANSLVQPVAIIGRFHRMIYQRFNLVLQMTVEGCARALE